MVSHLRTATVVPRGAVTPIAGLREALAALRGRPYADTTPSEMSPLIRDLQLVDTRGRKYPVANDRRRCLKAASSWAQTPTQRAERGREIPILPELFRATEFVHALRPTPANAADKPPCLAVYP